jgi:hypothetical protein
MNTFAELIERKNWTKVIKSFFLDSLNSLLWMSFTIDWNTRNSSLIKLCFLIRAARTFADWDKEKTFLSKKNLFSLSSIDFLEGTTCSNDRIELIKIRLALATSDDRILTKQSSDLDLAFSASRDLLATFLVKIRFALAISDDRIFIKSNSNSTSARSKRCERSEDLDVLS